MSKRRRRRSPGFDSDFPALTVAQAHRFLRDEPELYFVWMYLGKAQRELWQYGEARRAFRRAIALAPCQESYPRGDNAATALRSAYTEMGSLYMQKCSYPTAERWFRRAIAADPGHASGHIYLGAVLARQGRLAEAERIHRRGCHCRRGCVDDAHLNRGLVLRALEQFREAEACFRKTLKLNPKYAMARTGLRDMVGLPRFARARRRKISYDACKKVAFRFWAACGIALMRQRLLQFPENALTWVLLGITYGKLARYADARAAFARSMRFCPASWRHYVYSHLGWMYRYKGDSRRAEMWLRRAVAAGPRWAAHHVRLGELLADQGRLREAGFAFRRALRCPHVDVAEAHLHLGLVLRARGRYAQARQSLQVATESAKHGPSARQALEDIDRRLSWKYRPEWIGE